MIVIVASVGLTMFFSCNQSLPEDVFPSPKKNEKTGKWGFVYEGKTIIKYKFDDADEFSSGFARVGLDGKWGFIDKKGKKIIPLKYDFASIFSDDVAKVGLDGKYGFIDKTGNEVIPVKYELIGEFTEGLAKVGLNEKYGFIDKTGKEIIPLKYEEVGDFKNGFVKVMNKGKYSYIDKTGKMVFQSKQEYSGEIRFEKSKNAVLNFTLSADLQKVTNLKLKVGEMILTPENFDNQRMKSDKKIILKISGKLKFKSKFRD